MTDLISKLAADLVALNNASPRLPSKEQIEEVLHGALTRTLGLLQCDDPAMGWRTAYAPRTEAVKTEGGDNTGPSLQDAIDAAMIAQFPGFILTGIKP